jgi:hypothetical protein
VTPRAAGGDGATIFQHACSLGCEGIVSKGLPLPLRTCRSLAQGQEPGCARGETRGRGGLGPKALSAWAATFAATSGRVTAVLKRASGPASLLMRRLLRHQLSKRRFEPPQLGVVFACL